jgi:hypothetical protein
LRQPSGWWTVAAQSVSERAMIRRMSSATSVFLVARRHVDLGRVRSMICQPA